MASFLRSARASVSAARRATTRAFSQQTARPGRSLAPVALAISAATGAILYSQQEAHCAWYDIFTGGKKTEVEPPTWADVRARIEDIVSKDPTKGPLFVRLAWHAAGTYDKATGTGGSNGATMRFSPECDRGANAGLGNARDALEPIKAAHSDITYADLWTFAGCAAIEAMGGPRVPWTPGRTDAADGSKCPVDGRLPDASKDAVHIREVFYRMGFNDRDIVALIGAHTLGHCHADRSGYVGPWTRDPFGFDNSYFTLLLDEPWRVKKGMFPVQFEDSTGDLMMLPGDLALIIDPAFRKYVELYAKDEDAWHMDFASAFGRMLAFGMPAVKA